MLVYLMRHGRAVEQTEAPNVSDADRPLSEDGIHRMGVQAAAFRRMVGELDEIWTSPLLRARQTAEIIGCAWQPEVPVQEAAALGPDGESETILDRLRQADDDLQVLLIGHELGVTELFSRMLAGRTIPMFKLPCGAMCCLEMTALDPIVRAELHWLLTPRQLRALM